jgi:hypothetical protein
MMYVKFNVQFLTKRFFFNTFIPIIALSISCFFECYDFVSEHSGLNIFLAGGRDNVTFRARGSRLCSEKASLTEGFLWVVRLW